MGVIATKLQESNAAKSTRANTQAMKRGEKPKRNVKKPVPPPQRFYQGPRKKPSPTKPQIPLVKEKQERNLVHFCHYHPLNEKLNREVQEELEKSTSSSTSTSSDDPAGW
ncbi:hypothetical protein LEMLEM_LOCUS17305 [Lemmus lemmus]